jgi:hypothetical protein
VFASASGVCVAGFFAADLFVACVVFFFGWLDD